jgi:hypothetical protein
MVLIRIWYLHVITYVANQKNQKPQAVVKPEAQKEALPIEVPPLSVDEVKEKTDNFGSKSLIGEGSYGRVYYATLNDGKAVALKKLDVAPEAETNTEFLNQVINFASIPLPFNSFYLQKRNSLQSLASFFLGFHGFKTKT